MAFVPVPKDLSKIKTKVALNLTKRQIICFALAATFGLPVYFPAKDYIGTDMAATLMVIVMLPFFFLGMYEKDGFPAEKILYYVVRQKILYPGIRPYRVVNMYSRLEKQNKIREEIQSLEKKAKDNVAGRHRKAVSGKKAKTGSSQQYNPKRINKGRTEPSCAAAV